MVATSFPCQPRWGATTALAGAFLWGRAALLPSCYFVSRTVDYTNYGSMSDMAMLHQLAGDFVRADDGYRFLVRFEGNGLSEQFFVRKPSVQIDDGLLTA
jgi:hypothetical protein